MRARRRRIQRARNRGLNILGQPIAPRTSGGAQHWKKFEEIAAVGLRLINKLTRLKATLNPKDVERAITRAKEIEAARNEALEIVDPRLGRRQQP